MQDSIFASPHILWSTCRVDFLWGKCISALPKIVIGQKVFLSSRNCFCPTGTATIEKNMPLLDKVVPFIECVVCHFLHLQLPG